MTFVELVHAFLGEAAVAVVVTDAQLDRPGPTILYANAAFGRLTGRDHIEVIGMRPCFMQGKETRRVTLDAFHHALSAGRRFHAFLTNYRPDGTRYRVEIDCRPFRGVDGRLVAFIAFQREVIRRVGRPTSGEGGRYASRDSSNNLLAHHLRAMRVFEPGLIFEREIDGFGS
ncbi:PAS domain-containing protein [Methylobacterium sp. J-076]|uniref:PAS domain-containing protein n=1 Tax=Methylobacterium sp. J-076 TaxID=2836655 RepID=UPI00391B7BA8